MINSIRGFWVHTNGKVYAIESDPFGKILAAAGPFNADDLKNLNDYEYTCGIIEWVEYAVAHRKLRRFNP